MRAAKEKPQAALAIADKTPYESYVASPYRSCPSLCPKTMVPGAGQYADQIFNSTPRATGSKPQENASLMHAVGIAYYRSKDWAGAARWLDRAMQAGATDAAVS